MSKKKKNVEELMKEPLVPEEEQPYKIPENWAWVNLSPFIELERGITFPASAKMGQIEEGLIGCARTANIQEDFVWDDLIYVDKQYLKNNDNKLVRKDDILMSVANSYHLVGKVSLIDELREQITFGGFLLCIRAQKINKKFIYYYFKHLFMSGQIQKLARQTVNIANINTQTIKSLPLQLPPLTEQKRIVEKVERLLNKINEARQLIKEAKETFELRRAAILDKAFRGELSSDWRKLNQIKAPLNKEINKKIDTPPYSLPDSWSWVRLEDVCEKITDGTHHSPKSYSEGDYMYITAKNIKEQGIILDNVTYVSEEVHRDIYNRCDVKKGDVLYIKDGATTGIATVNHLNEEFSLLSSVGVLRTRRELLSPDYLSFCLNSPSTKERMLGMMSGNAIRRLTLKKIKQGIVPLPPIDEQMYIVNKLKHLFEVLYCEKSIIEKVESQLNSLKQSILSRAFRGELGTHDPTEESALELLKEVLSCD
jgi:type I restriction enzyme, S subunit